MREVSWGLSVDGAAPMRPFYGAPSTRYVGVRDSWGTLALMADWTAMRAEEVSERRWTSLRPDAFIDAAWLDGSGGTTLLRKLDGEGGRYTLAVDKAGRNAVLLGRQALVVSVDRGDMPEGREELDAVRSGRAFLLTRGPAERQAPLLLLPALEVEKGGPR